MKKKCHKYRLHRLVKPFGKSSGLEKNYFLKRLSVKLHILLKTKDAHDHTLSSGSYKPSPPSPPSPDIWYTTSDYYPVIRQVCVLLSFDFLFAVARLLKLIAAEVFKGFSEGNACSDKQHASGFFGSVEKIFLTKWITECLNHVVSIMVKLLQSVFLFRVF